MGPTSFGAAGVATLRQWRREQVYGNEAPPPPRPLCRARPPAREARERGAGLGAAAIAAAAAGTRGTSGRRGGPSEAPGAGPWSGCSAPGEQVGYPAGARGTQRISARQGQGRAGPAGAAGAGGESRVCQWKRGASPWWSG